MRALMLLTAAGLLPGFALGQDSVTRWPPGSLNALSSACEYLGSHAVDLGIDVDYRDVKDSYEREARERGADSLIWIPGAMAGMTQYYDCSEAFDEIERAPIIVRSLDEKRYYVHIIVWQDDPIAFGSLPIRYTDREVCVHAAGELRKAFNAAPGTEVSVSFADPDAGALEE